MRGWDWDCGTCFRVALGAPRSSTGAPPYSSRLCGSANGKIAIVKCPPKYWGNMLWSAKRYWQIFTDKREKKPSEKHEVAKPPSVFHEVFSRVWSEYLKFCWAKLSILPLFLDFWSPQPTVMNTGKYPTLLSVLWRRKTWNNAQYNEVTNVICAF